jgi:predicted ATPase/DNA-binding CsgD family transcriptional regulator
VTAEAIATARSDRRARPPKVRTSLVGRDEELANVTRLLRSSDASLITITGRSGSGKTRLALEAAHRLGPDLPGGAVVVSIDTVADISLLAAAVATALDLGVAPGQDPESAIRRELQYEPTLLVVDDIDELPGAAGWFADLVEDASGTKLLATAKAPLRKPAERVVRIGPLTTVDERTRSDADLLANPAVALFADRAAAVQHDFKLDRSNLRQVAELCRRLDGLPLAIELAAARSTALSPGAQLRMLDRGTALDLGRLRGSLREAIALSVHLVGPAEQATLPRMSVFEGAASIDALMFVCEPEAGEGEFLDQLMNLVDAHLVEADNTGSEPRFHLLPMIREFAREMLVAAGQQPQAMARQADYFVCFARAAADLPEHEQIPALAQERANLEMVLSGLVAALDTVRAARLAADMGWLWERYGWFPVAQRWVDELVSATESDSTLDPETRSLPLIWWVRLSLQHPTATARAGLIAERQKRGLELARESGSTDTILLALSAIYYSVLVTHDVGAAVAATFEGLEIARASNNERWLGRYEASAGVASNLSGDHATALQFAHSALARAQRSGDLAGLLVPVLMLSEGRSDLEQDAADSIPTNEELLANTRELGDVRGEGWVLSRLSAASMRRHDHAATLRWTIQGLELGKRTGLWDASGFAMVHLALLAAANREDAAVARLHGSIGRIMPEIAISMTPEALASYRSTIETVRERSGPPSFDRVAHAAGQVTWDDAVLAALDYANRLASTLPDRVPPSDPGAEKSAKTGRERANRLTKREQDVLALLATGATNNEIGQRLGLTAKTVMHHSMSIYAKLGVRGRAEATAWAFRHGVVGLAT